MRQAVAEMLAGKDEEQCRQMAIDTMERVRNFSQKIYPDAVVKHLRSIEFYDEADRREQDGEWLREQSYRGVREAFSDHLENPSMSYYFADFVNVLIEIGRIWAAQLLVRGIDMKQLEDSVVCIMNPANTPRYYVDKYYSDELPDQHCVSNDFCAEAWLKKMGRKLSQKCYLKLAEGKDEGYVKSKLSGAYDKLVKEGFLVEKETKRTTFIDVMMNNSDKKVCWHNDPRRKFLKEFISVLLGLSNSYSYAAILAPSDKGKQWTFVQQHFVDQDGSEIEIKSNTTKLGKKDKAQFERILTGIYYHVKAAEKARRP